MFEIKRLFKKLTDLDFIAVALGADYITLCDALELYDEVAERHPSMKHGLAKHACIVENHNF